MPVFELAQARKLHVEPEFSSPSKPRRKIDFAFFDFVEKIGFAFEIKYLREAGAAIDVSRDIEKLVDFTENCESFERSSSRSEYDISHRFGYLILAGSTDAIKESTWKQDPIGRLIEKSRSVFRNYQDSTSSEGEDSPSRMPGLSKHGVWRTQARLAKIDYSVVAIDVRKLK